VVAGVEFDDQPGQGAGTTGLAFASKLEERLPEGVQGVARAASSAQHGTQSCPARGISGHRNRFAKDQRRLAVLASMGEALGASPQDLLPADLQTASLCLFPGHLATTPLTDRMSELTP